MLCVFVRVCLTVCLSDSLSVCRFEPMHAQVWVLLSRDHNNVHATDVAFQL